MEICFGTFQGWKVPKDPRDREDRHFNPLADRLASLEAHPGDRTRSGERRLLRGFRQSPLPEPNPSIYALRKRYVEDSARVKARRVRSWTAFQRSPLAPSDVHIIPTIRREQAPALQARNEARRTIRRAGCARYRLARRKAHARRVGRLNV